MLDILEAGEVEAVEALLQRPLLLLQRSHLSLQPPRLPPLLPPRQPSESLKKPRFKLPLVACIPLPYRSMLEGSISLSSISITSMIVTTTESCVLALPA